MSYILDALQRAEAERERGLVPGLKSQLVPPAKRDRASASAFRPWHAALGLSLLLVALCVWWWAAGEDVPTAAPLAIPAGAPVVAPPPGGTVALPPTAPPPTSAPAIAVARPSPPAEPVLPILASPKPAPATTQAAKSQTAAPSAMPAAAPATPTANGATPPAPPPAAAPVATASIPAQAPTSAAVPGFGELSADARAKLPAVNVSGSTYSQNPALRMLIANGKVVQEGQDIAPGLRLETIGPRSAVLNHQGLRYSIGY